MPRQIILRKEVMGNPIQREENTSGWVSFGRETGNGCLMRILMAITCFVSA